MYNGCADGVCGQMEEDGCNERQTSVRDGLIKYERKTW